MRQEIHDYLQTIKAEGKSQKTIDGYRFRLKRFQHFMNAKKISDLKDVTVKLVRIYHNSLIKEQLKDSTIFPYMDTLKRFLSWVYKHKLTLTDLSEAVTLGKVGKQLPPKPLTLEEMKTILKGIDISTMQGKMDKAIVEIAYGAGLRRQEIIGLRVGDVDQGAMTIFVHGKGSKDRIVPINPEALEAVATYLASKEKHTKKTDYLFTFPNTDRPLSDWRFTQTFKRVNELLPKREVKCHLLRHTFACHMILGGIPLRQLQLLLGHSSPTTSMIYVTLTSKALKKAYDTAVEVLL